jgi:hypothetical protein
VCFNTTADTSVPGAGAQRCMNETHNHPQIIMTDDPPTLRTHHHMCPAGPPPRRPPAAPRPPQRAPPVRPCAGATDLHNGRGPFSSGGGGNSSKDRHTMRWRTTTKATTAGSPKEGVRFDDYSTNYKCSIRISSRHNSDDYTKWYIHSLKINSAATHCCFTHDPPHTLMMHGTNPMSALKP